MLPHRMRGPPTSDPEEAEASPVSGDTVTRAGPRRLAGGWKREAVTRENPSLPPIASCVTRPLLHGLAGRGGAAGGLHRRMTHRHDVSQGLSAAEWSRGRRGALRWPGGGLSGEEGGE